MSAACPPEPFPATLGDLDLVLDADDPVAVAALLARCLRDAQGAPVDVDLVSTLDVGEQTAWLLRLVAPVVERLDAMARCSSCTRAIEIELAIDDVLRMAAGVERDIALDVRGHTLRVRRPTGADLVGWANRGFAEAVDTRRAMAAELLMDTPPCPLGDAELDALDRLLSEQDPLVRFTVASECPHCGTTTEHEVDLAALAMERLAGSQVALVEAIHALASVYHWSEAEVLAIPAWRRSRYLSMIDRSAR